MQLSFYFALYMKGGEKLESISQISSLVKEYIMPETVWLVPCLYALGSIIKRSIRIDDTLIPTVLCVVGIFLSALVSVASCEPTNWIQWVILVAVSIGQGYVLAAAAVCLNQLIKQHGIAGGLKKGFDGQNSIERKEGTLAPCRFPLARAAPGLSSVWRPAPLKARSPLTAWPPLTALFH